MSEIVFFQNTTSTDPKKIDQITPSTDLKKSEKSLKKKIVRNFFQNLIFFNFFEIFTKDVLKPLLRGRETVRKKYRVVFEIFSKNMFFFDNSCPSITTIHHPSKQVGADARYPVAGEQTA